MQRKSSAAMATGGGAGAATSKAYVEFHASMSLDNPASSVLSFMAPSSSQQLSAVVATPATHEHTTLEDVLTQRFHVWSRVNDAIETLAPLEAYACDVAALKKLQELHHLCNILLYPP